MEVKCIGMLADALLQAIRSAYAKLVLLAVDIGY
jgi:hypothetical protein